MLKVGAKAPAFASNPTNGNEIALKDFAGQRVLLFFFPKASTPVEPLKRPSFVTQRGNSTSTVWPSSA